uniref:Plastid-encoded RNA polymerase subunit alpha n=1 Tax=Pseudocodium devriesii TaxID=453070 RepID=A0A386B0Y4_9CHLO|nr:RNA polymerase a-subunit [Pseudocodium devriesii]AYC65362.1 RNA polymerase a-subunit [Pseudocodium devriesii]
MYVDFQRNFYCISSRIETTGQYYGCYKIGPFSKHQSLTLANSLRRTLLAENPRCLFDAVQIQGVEHEFSNFVGLRESVLDLLLNLEKLTFQTIQPITKPQTAFVHFCGPGILRAEHIHLPSMLKCVHPSQYIATLEVDGQLTFKLFFSPNWNQLNPLLKKPFATNFLKRNLWSLNDFNCLNLSSGNAKNQKLHSTGSAKGPTFRSNTDSKDRRNIEKKRSAQDPMFRSQLFNKKNTFNEEQNSKSKNSIQENFLFIKTTSNAIERVNYTLQKEDLQRDHYQEYILLEVWTDGSVHPQKAISRALHQLLLEIYPYSFQYMFNELRSNDSEFLMSNRRREVVRKRQQITGLAKKDFREKFFNLDIGNFYFQTETLQFLREQNVFRIHDFKKINIQSAPSHIKVTLENFQIFIRRVLSLKAK